MSLARVQSFSVSLDGFGTGDGLRLDAPFGHAGEEADAIADRIIVLSHGKVIADGTPRSIKERVTTRTVSLSLPNASAADLAAIEAIPTVSEVARDGDLERITTTDPDAVVRALVGLGLTLRDLEVRGAALEDAFLALTTDDQAGRTPLPKGD